jgi:hypothetical protein
MEVTKLYKFVRVGAMEVAKPYPFIRFGAMEVTKRGHGMAAWSQGHLANGPRLCTTLVFVDLVVQTFCMFRFS